MRKLHNILVTGGCGFIGSNYIHLVLDNPDFNGKIINVDCLTYAANQKNLKGIKKDKRYFFEKVDIRDYKKLLKIFEKYNIDTVVHFAAETHVDRSIYGPSDFITTNINGTFNLLEAARNYWKCSLGSDNSDFIFHYISTDEVYGSLTFVGYFYETSQFKPGSPYSSSKASAQLLCLSYFNTYALPVTVSNCSNNFGPFQNEEKLIPHTIKAILKNEPIPVYGTGSNIRDWIFVDQHNLAVQTILKKGKAGECYNIGASNEVTNLDLIKLIINLLSNKLGKSNEELEKLITFVPDRPGHDFRYAINCDKLKNDLGFIPQNNFNENLEYTIDWYLEDKTFLS